MTYTDEEFERDFTYALETLENERLLGCREAVVNLGADRNRWKAACEQMYETPLGQMFEENKALKAEVERLTRMEHNASVVAETEHKLRVAAEKVCEAAIADAPCFAECGLSCYQDADWDDERTYGCEFHQDREACLVHRREVFAEWEALR